MVYERFYNSDLTIEELKELLEDRFIPITADESVRIIDESRPFSMKMEGNQFELLDCDETIKDQRTQLSGYVFRRGERNWIKLEAKPTRREVFRMVQDVIILLVLGVLLAFMEISNKIPLPLVIISFGVMVGFIFWYIRNSFKKIVQYRWRQLDEILLKGEELGLLEN